MSNTGRLAHYGWDAAFAEHFAALGDPAAEPGRVIRVDRGRCDVVTDSGDTVPAHLTAEASDVCTGDWVALTTNAGRHTVTAVLPRRTAIVRASAGGDSGGQVLAANVTTVLIATPLDTDLNLGRTERFLTLAWDSGATPVIVLTKADLADDLAAARQALAPVALGVDVIAVSVTTGEGLADLRDRLTGTIAILGQSGAGKSTLVNALLGDTAMAVGEVRADGKGRHTTTTRELWPLPGGGCLIDTPGLRGVGLQDNFDGLRRTFADIEQLAEDCRFADCGHDTEPGCAVRAAIEDGRLSERRLASFRKLLREAEWMAARTDPLLRAERRRHWKALSQAGSAAAAAKRRRHP